VASGWGGHLVAIYRAVTVAAIIGTGSALWAAHGQLSAVVVSIAGLERQVDKLDSRMLYLERGRHARGRR